MAAEPHAERSEALRQIAVDAPNYQGYQQLDSSRQEIRVLDLEADLTCTLRHVDLSNSPDYHALSCCRGPPDSAEALTIKSPGADETETVQIRKTLAKFLKSLYKQYGRVTVWLDVICINQRSFAEQSAQVAMMGDIYRCAKAVYAWVGPWDPDIEYFFRFASRDHELPPRFDLNKVNVGLEKLFSRPYWTRVWIIQECVLNQQLLLVCGPLSIRWETLQDGATDISKDYVRAFRPSGVICNRYYELCDARQRAFYVSDRGIIEEALHFQQAQCTDPHDKIYGFRALATVGSGLKVDYSCNLFDLLIATVSVQNWDRFQNWQLIHEQKINRGQEWWTGFEKSPSKAMIGDGCSLFKLMSLGAHDILVALQAQPADWLVMPLRQAKSFSHTSISMIFVDETCGLNLEEMQQIAVRYLVHRKYPFVCDIGLEDLLIVVLDDGRIIALKYPEGYIPGGPSRGLDSTWAGQIWVCNVHRAVHVSRWLYAMFMAQELSHYREAILMRLDSYSESRPRAMPPRHCGCESNPTTPYPSPWPAKRNDAVQDESAIS